MKKRGAKIKLLKSLDSELNQAQTFKNFIIEVLNLKSENDEDINYICSVAHGFEESLNDTGASKIVGDRRFKAHMRHEELTDKSLTTCIYYLFEKGTSPKSIEIGISKLLHGIEITQGKKLYIKINGLIRTCVRYKIKEDEIAERRVGNDSVIYNRLFPDDWNIVIDSDWKYETTHYKIEKNNLSDNNIGVNSQKSKKIPESKKSGFNKWKYLIISLIIIGVLYFLYPKTFTNEEPEPDKITELNSMEYITPLFDKNDKRYKLMIIPFNQECNYKGALNDIGKVIEMRLEDLSKKDSLNLNVRYIDTLTPNKSKTDSTWAGYFERIMKENYANQIIYGATRENNCTSSSFNEICINYIIDIDRSLKHKSENTNYKFYSTSREAITQGKLQENIDFVIYMNAIYSLDIENISKGLKYVNKIIDSLDVSQNNLLKAYYERMRLNSYNNFFSDIVRADAEFIIKNDSAKTLPIDSRIDVKIKLGDSSVIEDLNQFVENQPDDWYPYFQRGFYYGLSEDSLRMKDFNRAIKFSKENSNTISIYQTIAGWHSDQLNWGASIEWYTQAINLKDNYLSRLSRGICYYYLNSPTSAIKDFEVATVLNTKKTEPFLWIGLTYLSINDTQKALEYYDVAISISNDLNEIFMTIYDLVEFKQYEEALQYLDCLLNEKKLDRRDIFYAKYFKFICYQRLDNQSEVNRLNDELIKFPLPFEAELKDHILYLGYTFLD